MMILAVLSANAHGVFYLVALILFLIAAFLAAHPPADRPSLWALLVALGLAFWVFPAMWDSFAL